MPYELTLITRLKKARWKVKIRDAERLEEPHVTILWKHKTWRLSLRTKEFLEQGQSWREVDAEVQSAIQRAWETLKEKWDVLKVGRTLSGKPHHEQER